LLFEWQPAIVRTIEIVTLIHKMERVIILKLTLPVLWIFYSYE